MVGKVINALQYPVPTENSAVNKGLLENQSVNKELHINTLISDFNGHLEVNGDKPLGARKAEVQPKSVWGRIKSYLGGLWDRLRRRPEGKALHQAVLDEGAKPVTTGNSPLHVSGFVVPEKTVSASNIPEPVDIEHDTSAVDTSAVDAETSLVDVVEDHSPAAAAIPQAEAPVDQVDITEQGPAAASEADTDNGWLSWGRNVAWHTMGAIQSSAGYAASSVLGYMWPGSPVENETVITEPPVTDKHEDFREKEVVQEQEVISSEAPTTAPEQGAAHNALSLEQHSDPSPVDVQVEDEDAGVLIDLPAVLAEQPAAIQNYSIDLDNKGNNYLNFNIGPGPIGEGFHQKLFDSLQEEIQNKLANKGKKDLLDNGIEISFIPSSKMIITITQEALHALASDNFKGMVKCGGQLTISMSENNISVDAEATGRDFVAWGANKAKNVPTVKNLVASQFKKLLKSAIENIDHAQLKQSMPQLDSQKVPSKAGRLLG